MLRSTVAYHLCHGRVSEIACQINDFYTSFAFLACKQFKEFTVRSQLVSNARNFFVLEEVHTKSIAQARLAYVLG